MRLADALRIESQCAVTFTGAGGKSTAISCLVGELAAETPLVVTTTTSFLLGQPSLSEAHLILRHPHALDKLLPLLDKHRSVLVTGEAVVGEKKWMGLSLSSMDALHTIVQGTEVVMLIEADNARGRSLKVPAEHEPVIPPFTDLVVPVVGLDVVGAILSDNQVHRPERVTSLLGLPAGERLGPDHIAALMLNSEGGLKSVPQQAEVRVLLNKAETDTCVANGRSIAGKIIASPRVQAAVLASVAQDPPVLEVIGRVAGIILAAGDSRRLGQPKQLIAWRGRPLVWHAVRAALRGGLSPVLVVVGAGADGVRRALADEQVIFVENKNWPAGLSTSLQAGLAAVGELPEAVVLLLSDMPFVDAVLVEALIQEYRRTLSPLVAPRAGGRQANPVLFDRVTFSALREVQGDRGGHDLFQHFPIAWVAWDESILFDLDTLEDLQRLRERE